MNKIIFNFIGNIKFSIITFLIVILGFSKITAQTSLEMFPKATTPTNPTGNGPVQSTKIYLQDNTNNPTGNTVAAANNPVDVTYTLSNHAYAYNNNPAGTNFMTNIGMVANNATTSGDGKSPIYPLMNSLANPSDSFYTAGTTTGQGMDVTANRNVIFHVYVQPLETNNVNATSRVKVCNLTLTFSRPVDNPILHITGMGAFSSPSTFSAEFNVLGGYTLTKLSGIDTTGFIVSGNQINNNNTNFTTSGAGSGSGSVRVNGTDISTLTLEVYLDGSDNNSGVNWNGLNVNDAGESVAIGVSLPQNVLIANNDTYPGGKQGTSVTTASVLSNDTFNGGTATTTNVTVSGTTVPAGFTVNTNGTITKAASVTSGTYNITYQICDNTEAGNCKSATATITVLVDSDGDGITDDIDIDDDNDGISDTVECPNCTSDPFGNGGFESPVITTGYSNVQQANMPNWSTTATDGFIELWQNNFAGVPAAEGNQFVELNATQVSTLYQTFCVPALGGVLNWSIKHRGRLGTDVAEVRIGTSLTSYTVVANMSDGNTAWGSYSGSFNIPAGSSGTYYIMFSAVSSAGGDNGIGNFIDDVKVNVVQNCADTDNDGTPDVLDLDSDNDGCLDAIEGGADIKLSQLVNSAGNVSVGTGSTASNQNLCASGSCVNAQGLPQFATLPTNYSNTTGQVAGTSYAANPQAVAGTVSANQLITSGATPSPISITGSTGSIQWQTSSDNVNFTNISGATNATYSPGALSSTTYYRAVLTNVGGCSVNSNVITIAIDSDRDGIANNIDIDDDNDGISDAEECKYCSGGGIPFGNGGFESPNFAGTTYAYIGASSVPNWSTTASTNQIELWKSGFNGVPAAEGNQFAELNANEVSTLYQAFCVPLAGGTLNWSIKHRGRNGIDVAEVRLGTSLNNYNVLATMSDGNTAWGSYSGTVNIPANNSGTYYIMFASVSAAGGNAGVGNFLDDIQINIIPNCPDTDGDGIPNNLDLDSDNDGCLDAIEGGADVKLSQLVNRAGIVSVGTGSTASNQNLCGGTSCVNVEGLPQFTTVPTNYNNSTGQTTDISQDASIGANACKCFKAGATGGTALPTNHGISALGRAGNDGDGNTANDWPMVRKGAWTALEGKSKGFVINRIPTTAQVNAIPNPVEGMMVYDEEADCLKIYTKDDAPATTSSWRCFNNQTCPDVL